MQTARTSPPSLVAAEYVHWRVDDHLHFTHVAGSGLSRAGLTAQELVGRSIEVVYPGRPDITAIFRRALAGQDVDTVVEFAGSLWRVEAAPEYADARIVGVMGTSHVLEPAPERSEKPREREWELVSLPRAYFGPLRSGDRFLVVDGKPGACAGRHLTDGEWANVLVELGDRLRMIRDTNPLRPDRSRRNQPYPRLVR